MKDLKFEQKRTLTRLEAADLLSTVAAALRRGGHVDLELGPGVLSMHVPDELHSELEVEVGESEVELEIELKWPTGQAAAHERPAPDAPASTSDDPGGGPQGG
jgi:amphi-Trp domain-containing protein